MKKKEVMEYINLNNSIKNAMLSLNKIPIKTLLVIKNNKLVATLSDGDIRRGLVGGKNINSQVSEICNYDYKYVNNIEDKVKIEKLFKKFDLPFIPVVDKNFKILDIIYQDSRDYKNTFMKNVIFILAGGEGKRLLPLTKKLPKPIIKVGKLSIIEIIFSFFKSSGYNNFLISLNYKKDEFKKYLSKLKDTNYQFIEEKKKLGTAGSLSLIRNIKKPFFIINGDIICNTNYSSLMEFHTKNKAKLTIVTRRIEKKSQYGVLDINKNKIVRNISEKPVQYDFINAGIYVADPTILKLLRRNQKIDMPDLIEILIKNKMKVVAYEIYDYWRDIGTIENLNEVRSAISHMIK